MQTEIQTTLFNYDILDCKDADRVFLKGKEEVIKSRTAQTVIENGRDLLEAKERVGHGNFLKWVEGVFPWSQQTAVKMMRVADEFKQGLNLNNFQTSALYALAAPSTPEAARAEALELAEAGEKITHKHAQELIQAHKEIQAKNQQLADMHAQIKELEIRLPTDETVAEINRLKAELDNLKNNPVQVEKKVIKEVQVAPPDYIDLKNEKMNLEIEKADLQKKIKELQDAKDQLNVEWVKKKSQESERDMDTEKLKARIARLEKEKNEQAARLSRKASELKDQLRAATMPDAEKMASYYLSEAKSLKLSADVLVGRLTRDATDSFLSDTFHIKQVLKETIAKLTEFVEAQTEIIDIQGGNYVAAQ